jgi:WD40 repeat protein
MVLVLLAFGMVIIGNGLRRETTLQHVGHIQGFPQALAFSSDERSLAVGTAFAGTVRWNIASEDRSLTEEQVWPEPQQVLFVAFAADATTIILAGGRDSGRIEQRRLDDRSLVSVINPALLSWVHGMALLPERNLLAISTADGVHLWDLATASLRQTLPAQGGELAVSSNGTVLALGASEHITLWDLQTGQQRWSVAGRDVVAIAPNGHVVASACRDRTQDICLWHGDDGRLQTILQHHTRPIGDLAFSPQGDLLVSTDSSGAVTLWDWANERLIEEVSTSTPLAATVAFDQRGETIGIIAERDLWLWDVRPYTK